MPEPLISALGVNGQIELFRDHLVIKRKGVMGFITQGLKGDKEIRISSISSVQMKAPGALTNGYIQFAFHGGQEAKGALFQSVSDENSVLFKAEQAAAFRALASAVRARLDELLSPAAPPATPAPGGASLADEIRKLAGLRDEGLLTDEEFQEQKRKLLA